MTMADIADLADEQSEIYLADAMNRVRRAALSPLTDLDTLACANCDAPLPSKTLRYCDIDCRQDFEKRQVIRRKQGLL